MSGCSAIELHLAPGTMESLVSSTKNHRILNNLKNQWLYYWGVVIAQWCNCLPHAPAVEDESLSMGGGGGGSVSSWCDGSSDHGGPIELFLVPPSASRLV